VTDDASGLHVLLAEGATDDFVELRVLAYHVAATLGLTDSARYDSTIEARIRAATLEIVLEALREGFAKVVTFDDVTGALTEWDLDGDSVVRVIDEKWRALGRPLRLYEVACIRLTDRGRRIGLALAAAPTPAPQVPS